MKRFFAALVSVVSFASASAQNAGVWYGSSDADSISTHVNSDDGSVLTFLCSKTDESCLWGLSINVSCEKDELQPILGSSIVGAAHLTLVCAGPSSRKPLYAYVIKEYTQTLNLLSKGGIVGFVTPLASGRFSVIRFNADGAMTSAERAASAVKAQAAKKSPTKSEEL